MLWHSARLKKDREQHLSGAHLSATKGHLCTCKSGQTQTERHSYPSEKSHYRQSCHSPGVGMFHGVLLANSQWAAPEQPRESEIPGTQQACTAHQHIHTASSSQEGPKTKCAGGYVGLKGQDPALLSSTSALFISVMCPKPERHILNPVFILRWTKKANLTW